MKYLDMKGKTVTTTGGKYIGKVLDLLIDPDQAKLHGLIIVNSNAVRRFQYIPFYNFNIYRDIVTVNGMIINVNKSYLKKNKDLSMQNYINKEVYSRSGEKLGVLCDCIFDIKTAKILALTISNGFFEDIFEGRKIYITKENLIFKDRNIEINKGCCTINSSAFYKKYLGE